MVIRSGLVLSVLAVVTALCGCGSSGTKWIDRTYFGFHGEEFQVSTIVENGDGFLVGDEELRQVAVAALSERYLSSSEWVDVIRPGEMRSSCTLARTPLVDPLHTYGMYTIDGDTVTVELDLGNYVAVIHELSHVKNVRLRASFSQTAAVTAKCEAQAAAGPLVRNDYGYSTDRESYRTSGESTEVFPVTWRVSGERNSTPFEFEVVQQFTAGYSRSLFESRGGGIFVTD